MATQNHENPKDLLEKVHAFHDIRKSIREVASREEYRERLLNAILAETHHLRSKEAKNQTARRTVIDFLYRVFKRVWDKSRKEPFTATPQGDKKPHHDSPLWITYDDLKPFLDLTTEDSVTDKLLSLVKTKIGEDGKRLLQDANAPPVPEHKGHQSRPSNSGASTHQPARRPKDKEDHSKPDPKQDQAVLTAEEAINEGFYEDQGHVFHRSALPPWKLPLPIGIDVAKDIMAEASISELILGTGIEADQKMLWIGPRLTRRMTGNSEHFKNRDTHDVALMQFWLSFNMLQQWTQAMEREGEIIPLVMFLRTFMGTTIGELRAESAKKANLGLRVEKHASRLDPSGYEPGESSEGEKHGR
ncbi:Uu.00g106190.m01.CDS01 [Anthostomella pinea]|uniref:Uu.00g106190.m01.CDS01 n=1 Tax=Anthostomella pinea TaxID=933095 RepID=A0AAI8YG02_9PEZI|nr:Uu.00g106190.m01.CDS01 [Anthostomella pinea]